MADLSPQEILRLYQLGRTVEWRYRLGEFTDLSLARMLATLDKARREILAAFEARYATIPEWTADRLEAVLFELDDLAAGVRRRLGLDIGDAAGWAGSHSADWHMGTLTVEGAAAPSLFNNVALSPEQVRSFFAETPLGGRLLDEWVDRAFIVSVQEAIRAEMNAGVLLGEGFPGIVRRLTQGLDVFTKREAVTLARTYVQAANIEAQRQVFEANRDVVKGWIWTATIDNRTCVLCAALDGREYGWDEEHPPIPRHPRCRCMRRPKTLTWRELGIDLDELEDVARPYTVRDPGNIDEGGKRTIREVGFHKGDFASWWKKQPEDVQAQIVGPGRLELIRQGKASFRDLVDPDTGSLRRLDELGGDRGMGRSASAARAKSVRAEGFVEESGALRRAVEATVDERKISGYALNPASEGGKHKALVFEKALGMTQEHAGDLMEQVRAGVAQYPAQLVREDQYGKRFAVFMPVNGPKARAIVKTAWIVEREGDAPRLTTLMVGDEKEQAKYAHLLEKNK